MAVAGSRVGPNADVEHPGLAIGMMGMYIFLASEVMFFGSLFAVYFYLFGSHPLGFFGMRRHGVKVCQKTPPCRRMID